MRHPATLVPWFVGASWSGFEPDGRMPGCGRGKANVTGGEKIDRRNATLRDQGDRVSVATSSLRAYSIVPFASFWQTPTTPDGSIASRFWSIFWTRPFLSITKVVR